MAQNQGTYPGLCLLTDSDGKVITIVDSVSGDTCVFTHTNTGPGEFDICYPEVLGSGVPYAALADFGTHQVENTATEGYAFTLGDEEYLVRQNVIAPTPGEINDVLYWRQLTISNTTVYALVTADGNVVQTHSNGGDEVYLKSTEGIVSVENDTSSVIAASGLPVVLVGGDYDDGAYTINYGFNAYVIDQSTITPEVAEWVDTVYGSFYSRNFNTSSTIWGKAMALIKKRSGNYAAGITIRNFTNTGAGYSEPISEVICPLFIDTDDIPSDAVPVGQLKALVSQGRNLGMSGLMSDAEGWEDDVLGLTDTSIVSVGEIDMDGADIGTTTNIDSSLITLPSFLSDYIIVGTTIDLPAQLNSFVIMGTVNADDYVDDLRIDVAGAVANFANGKVMISTTEIGTYELDYQKAIEITSSRSDNVTDVYLR